MPTPVRSELRSLRHSRIVDVVFQEDAKNFGLFIQKDRILNAKIALFLSFRAYLNEKMTISITFYAILAFQRLLIEYFCVNLHRVS